MTPQVTLRPLTDSDGEAVRHLMEDDPPSPGMRMTTRFLVDPVVAWRALKPDMAGVVAVTPGDDRIVGVATVDFDTVQFNGQLVPSAFLGNLKVHHEARRSGIGKALAAWRVRTAEERIGPGGVILTGTSSDNIASQNTMKTWGAELHRGLVMRPRPALNRAPRAAGLRVIAPEPAHYAQVVERANRFFAEYQLYPPLTADKLAALRSTSNLVTHYRIVLDSNGEPVAGVMLSLRGLLMQDEASNIPAPLRVLNAFLHMIPPDGRLRLCEAAYLWFTHPDAGHLLWKHIRWEFRDRASIFGLPTDLRSPQLEALRYKPWHVPKFEVVTGVRGPEPLDTARLFCGTLRG